MILAVTHLQMDFWWIALGLGFVIILAVIILLTFLSSLVRDIDLNVADLWETATQLAANTATTWMLQQSGTASGELADEVGRHAQLLAEMGGR